MGVASVVALVAVSRGMRGQLDDMFVKGDAHLVLTRKGASDPLLSYLADTLVAELTALDRVRARSIGFVFQLHNLIPTLTAAENVELPQYALRVRPRERRARARELLDAVGLGDRATHLPGQLSGGQRQRVAVARALVNRPKLVLLDEPTGDLDQATGRQVLELLSRLRTEGELTLVLVTHDPAIARSAERTIRILDGRIVEDRRNAPADLAT